MKERERESKRERMVCVCLRVCAYQTTSAKKKERNKKDLFIFLEVGRAYQTTIHDDSI